MAEYIFNNVKAIKVGEKVFDNNDINVGDKILFHYDDERPDIVMVVTKTYHQGHELHIDGIDGIDAIGNLYACKLAKKMRKNR